MLKGLKYAMVAGAAMLALASCTREDINPGDDVIIIKGVEVDPLVKLAVDDVIPVSYPVTVLSTCKVSEDVTVDMAIDNSLVDEYNKKNKTNYAALPETDVELDSPTVTIKAGRAASEANNMTLKTIKNFEDGKIYIIPVTIKGVSGDHKVLDSEKTIYIKIAQTLKLGSIDMNNADFSSNFIFADDKRVDLEQYTFEIKIYPYRWHGMTPTLSRLCAFETAEEKQPLLYRFGEVVAEDVLQILTPDGTPLVSSYKYPVNKWTMISVVYDGSSIGLYNDGVLDATISTTSGQMKFGRIELGMSYQGYGSTQLYNGRATEIRVWSRPLSSVEMKANLCGVAPDSEGLVAYYKFNEPSGSIFKDATGHGYDMDWSKTVRAVTGEDLVPQNKASAIKRVSDELNKCAN